MEGVPSFYFSLKLLYLSEYMKLVAGAVKISFHMLLEASPF